MTTATAAASPALVTDDQLVSFANFSQAMLGPISRKFCRVLNVRSLGEMPGGRFCQCRGAARKASGLRQVKVILHCEQGSEAWFRGACRNAYRVRVRHRHGQGAGRGATARRAGPT